MISETLVDVLASIGVTNEGKSVSNIVSLSLARSSDDAEVPVNGLTKPIEIIFKALSMTQDMSKSLNVTCMFYDITTNSWSATGIQSTFTLISNQSLQLVFDLKCSTNHLTSFIVFDQSSSTSTPTSNGGNNVPTTPSDPTLTIVLAVVIPVVVFILLIVIIICVVVGLLWYRYKIKKHASKSSSKSNTVVEMPLQDIQNVDTTFESSSVSDYPTDESLRFTPLTSVREMRSITSTSSNKSSSFDPKARYTNLTKIGQGGFASVYKANDTKCSNAVKALKVIRYNSNEELNGIMKEGMQLMNITHPNILKVNDLFIDNDNLVCIDMEYYGNGDLNRFLNVKSSPCPEAMIKKMLHQTCSALDFVHTKLHMIHRDVKPSNIFIKSIDMEKNDIEVVLADFGLAKPNQGSVNNSYAGTPLYMSPELGLGGKYQFNTDIYSLGVTFYQIITRDIVTSISHLYLSKDTPEVMQILRTKMQESGNYSSELIEVLLSMLQKDNLKRPNASDILENGLIF